jgi:serine/threonine-protein kinase
MDPSPPPEKPDRVGDYLLRQRIGEGAGAEVYRAVHLDTGAQVAIKRVHRSRQRFFERLAAELHAMQAVEHPNVVAVFGGGVEQDYAWIAMELVDGVEVNRWVEQAPGAERRQRILRAGAQVADGLAAVHDAGFLHRDLKPANILVDKHGQARLLDFGFAHRIDATSAELAAAGIAGTLRYMSPEQLAGKELDLRADLYGLGAVLFELLAGVAPFVGEDANKLVHAICTSTAQPIGELCPDLPAGVAALIDRLLSPAAADRPRSARVVAEVLRQALGEPGSPATVRPRVLSSRFVGDRGTIRKLRDRCLSGDRSTLLLHGPAGMGLSRVLQELRGELLLRGARQTLVPGGPDLLARVLDALVGPLVPQEARLALMGPDLHPLLQALPDLARSDEQISPPASGAADPAVLREAARRVVERAARQRPLLIAVDDADRARPDDLAALSGVAFLVLASHEPENIAIAAEALPVRPLTPSQLAEAARAMIGDPGPELAWQNASAIQGSPGALVRLARAWAAEQQPVRPRIGENKPGGLRWDEALANAERALMRYGPADAAAWLSRPSEPPPATGTLRHRIEITRARIAYQLGHDAACLAHTARAGEAAETDRDRNSAVLEATRSALRRGMYEAALVEARAGLIQAQELGETDLAARWSLLIGRTLARQGQLRLALTIARGALADAAVTGPNRVGLQWLEGAVCIALCRWDEAERALREALGKTQENRRVRFQAGLNHQVGQMLLRRGASSLALNRLEAAAAGLERIEDAELQARVLADLSRAQVRTAHFEGARASAAAAWQRAQQVSSRFCVLKALAAGLFQALTMGDRQECRLWLQRAGELPASYWTDAQAVLAIADRAAAWSLIGNRDVALVTLQSLDLPSIEDPYDRAYAALRTLEVRVRAGQQPFDELNGLLETTRSLDLASLHRQTAALLGRLGQPVPQRADLLAEAELAGDALSAHQLKAAASAS